MNINYVEMQDTSISLSEGSTCLGYAEAIVKRTCIWNVWPTGRKGL